MKASVLSCISSCFRRELDFFDNVIFFVGSLLVLFANEGLFSHYHYKVAAISDYNCCRFCRHRKQNTQTYKKRVPVPKVWSSES